MVVGLEGIEYYWCVGRPSHFNCYFTSRLRPLTFSTIGDVTTQVISDLLCRPVSSWSWTSYSQRRLLCHRILSPGLYVMVQG